MNSENNKFNGWKILAVLWLLFFNMSLVMYGGSVLNAYMARSLEMARDSFGGGISLSYLIMGLSSPLVAVLVHKIDVRRVLVMGMLVQALGGLILGTMVRDAFGFAIGYGVIMGFGVSIGGILPMQTTVANWFERKRSLATAIFLSAGGMSGFLGSYLFSYLIDETALTWQSIWLGMMTFSVILSLLAYLVIRETPGELGQKPDGVQSKDDLKALQAGKTLHIFQTAEVWTLKKALFKPVFWYLNLGLLGMAVTYEVCAATGVIHLMDTGINNQLASFSVGLLSLSSVIGRLTAGFFADRIEPRYILAFGSTLIAVGTFLIVQPAAQFMILLYAMLTGFGHGLCFVCAFALLANYFGPRLLPSILGITMPFILTSSALGIYLTGRNQVNSGNYQQAFVIVALVAAGAAFFAFIAAPVGKGIQQIKAVSQPVSGE
ncbi:MAG: MFS transporter [Anaerolineaceae bacterium]|nr:MFS transporter [Anaerolineaceae bacterium]